MELKYYLDKAIDEYAGRMGTITTKKIMNYVYSEYNIDANVEDITNILKNRESILEIVDGIFVDENSFLSLVEKTETNLLKSYIEFQYFISINQEQMAGILDIIKSNKGKKLNLDTLDQSQGLDKATIENGEKTQKSTVEKSNEIQKENENKWTYSKIVNFGMENGYVKSNWVENIDYTLEKEVYDYFQTVEEIEDKGIEIKY
ncbi:hypothetical protein [Clostridium grantii]|uniref:Uncharacterized protein n=1 Tax=Clostridium grantii DSM 8605 TaxID=1121316 RepID=A0A1M5XXI0_9CLOT|nr:hypothetical protein [Clostridium grantii]SHI04500.1 hypothetical protein SAMN02745207_04011 [Clostridium grantii DSM 8605]